MKTLILSISASLATVASTQAQITLTQQTSVPQIGQSYSFHEVPATTLNVYNGGANQTWDFSSLGSGTLSSSNVVSPANASDQNSFPQATLVDIEGTAELYMKSNSSSLVSIGMFTPNDSRITYSTPMVYLPFSLTYSTTSHDTLIGIYEDFVNSISFNLNGFTDIKADGYGTLILPGTTVNNVLKIRTINSITSTFMGQSSTATDTTYSWYSLNTKINLAAIATNGDVSYLSASSLTSLKEEESFNYSIYPNPTQDFIKIKVDNLKENTRIEIYDVLGNLVLSNSFTTKLAITNLPKGIYIATFRKKYDSIYRANCKKLKITYSYIIPLI